MKNKNMYDIECYSLEEYKEIINKIGILTMQSDELMEEFSKGKELIKKHSMNFVSEVKKYGARDVLNYWDSNPKKLHESIEDFYKILCNWGVSRVSGVIGNLLRQFVMDESKMNWKYVYLYIYDRDISDTLSDENKKLEKEEYNRLGKTTILHV